MFTAMLSTLIWSCTQENHDSGSVEVLDILEGKQISDVVIGVDRPDWVEASRLKRYTRVQKGDTYSVEVIDEDIRGLYESGLIDDLRTSTQQMGSQVRVIYQATARRPPGPVRFIGNKDCSDSLLFKQLDELVPSVETLEDCRDALLQFYRDRGYNECRIALRAWEGGPATTDDFVFQIEEGPRMDSLQER